MSNDLKPEISPKSKYWIERHRYYELKHFCLQYQRWKDTLRTIDGYGYVPVCMILKAVNGRINDPTERSVEARELCTDCIALVEETAKKTSADLSDYILKAVTRGLSYEHMRAVFGMPCCRQTYYELYRRFFWLLDKARK